MNAISENNTKEVDYDACISCMKCVKDCPTDAKSMGFVLKNIAASALSKNERREPEYFL